MDSSDDGGQSKQFYSSEWFTRGWTLQELLAPSQVEFYDQAWNLLGTKDSLLDVISKITGIPENCLISRKAIVETSIAMRMSWAASRATTRKEDASYCLLGLFDVNMPLLYGEGRKAFIRLQLEIIQKSSDESIFAWTTAEPVRGLLAPSPRAFADSADVRRPFARWKIHPYTMTNVGLKIRKIIWPADQPKFPTHEPRPGLGIMKLNCYGDRGYLGLFVECFEGTWHRVHCSVTPIVYVMQEEGKPKALYVYQPGL